MENLAKKRTEKRKPKRRPKGKEVGTIRDKRMIKAITAEAYKMGDKPYMLLRLGFNTGLRISDLLPLRVRDVRQGDSIELIEQKTGKAQRVAMPSSVRAELARMTEKMDDDDLLFPSPQIHKRGQPIDYTTAYKWINTAARRAGVKGRIGCHTMRKTFGYHYYYANNHDVATLMEQFNHSSQSITLRYIGVDFDQKRNAIERMGALG